MLKPGDYLPGERIRIEAVIGEGAFGVVYRAWDETLSRRVAVKALRRDAPGMGSTTFGKYVDRFRREARVQAQFTHPHIVHVYRLVEQGDALYLVMEFVDGPNLRDALAQRGPLPLEEAVQLTLDLLDALVAVHTHKWDIVHRDIKPSNVLVADGRAKLTDFGLAQLASESSRSVLGGNHPGTPLYMSPEQERTVAYLKPASDLYSVGCVLFELLTGRPYKQVDDDPNALLRLRPDALPALAQMLQRATAEDPAQRYRRAAEFAAALRAWQRELQAARKAEQARQQREAEATAQVETTHKQREPEEKARREIARQVEIERHKRESEQARSTRSIKESHRILEKSYVKTLNWSFVLWWVLASTLGGSAGSAVRGFVLNTLFNGVDSVIWVISGAVFGAIIGVCQWWILKSHIRRAGWWIVANIVGWFLASIVGWVVSNTNISWFVGQIVIGACQWWILKSYIRKSGWWILASIVGGGVGIAVGGMMGNVVGLFGGAVVNSVIGNIISGSFLRWLLKNHKI